MKRLGFCLFLCASLAGCRPTSDARSEAARLRAAVVQLETRIGQLERQLVEVETDTLPAKPVLDALPCSETLGQSILFLRSLPSLDMPAGTNGRHRLPPPVWLHWLDMQQNLADCRLSDANLDERKTGTPEQYVEQAARTLDDSLVSEPDRRMVLDDLAVLERWRERLGAER